MGEFKVKNGCLIRYRGYKTNITIPNDVRSIGESAFWGCESIESVIIPNGVTYIGQQAFENCTSLKSVSIPKSVEKVGFRAFNNCTSLNAVFIEDLKAWCMIDFPHFGAIAKSDGSLFSGSFSVNEIDKEINTSNPLGYAHNLYLNNELVTEISLNFWFIASSLFEGCTSLKSVVLEENVSTVAGSVFMGCTSLENLTIKGDVTAFGYRAFKDCTSLKNFVFPDSIESIFEDAFNGCTSLTELKIPNSVTEIKEDAFRACTSLKSVTLPKHFQEGFNRDYAFYGCDALENIQFSD